MQTKLVRVLMTLLFATNMSAAWCGPIPQNPPNKNVNEHMKDTQISKPMDLPDVPQYTGKARFTSGWVTTDDRSQQPTYTLRYAVDEDDNVVAQWYHQALRAHKWQIERNGMTISATNTHGAECQVLAWKANLPKEKTRLTIVYTPAPR